MPLNTLHYPSEMSDPKNILIIRLSAIGDVVFASPLIHAIKRTYPDARLSWLIEPAAASLLSANPLLDEVIIWPKAEWKKLWKQKQWLQLWRELRAFRRLLKSKGFDVAIDLQGLQKSALWAYLSGAKRRIGLGSKEATQHLMTEVVDRQGNDKRIGSEYLKMAQYLGLETGDFSMNIALSADDEAYAQEMCRQGDYIVICPFTTRPQKHWLTQHWIEFIHAFAATHSLRIVMLGGPADKLAAEEILSHAPQLESRVGACSLTQTAALIKYSRLLVGVDTGLTHMGIAYHRPTVAIFGSTCPYLETTRDNARVLYHKQDCSPCRRNPSCDGAFTCMRLVTPEQVMQTLAEIGVQ